MPSAVANSSVGYSYAVFSLVRDRIRSLSIPIGVALWSPQSKVFKIRLIGTRERLKGVKKSDYVPFVRLVRKDIEEWTKNGRLPYMREHFEPSDNSWWQHVSKLLQNQILLTEPKPIDCRDPDSEIEPLYESVVSKHRPPSQHRNSVAGEIKRCLNGLGKKYKPKQMLAGFGNREVQVLRALRTTEQTVVIEGMNLAAKNPEVEADATASRLQRIMAGESSVQIKFLVGYLATPEGLNGEAPLVDWIKTKTQAMVFDLTRQRNEFRSAAEDLAQQ